MPLRLTGRGKEPGIKKEGDMIRCRKNGVRDVVPEPCTLDPLWTPRLREATSRHVFEGQGHYAPRTAPRKCPNADSPSSLLLETLKMEGDFETGKRNCRPTALWGANGIKSCSSALASSDYL